ncbi:hypothetical protein Fot_47930 [Forsythia ovata]|uniref:Uncharacterized protein n=1 Tax=Forsythia ovata TaxID=205694 RepID=A0ABD1QUP2_9LAMI
MEDDSQDPSDPRTDSDIMGEVSFSPEEEGEVEQRSIVSIFPPASTSEPETTKIPLGRAFPKAKSRKNQGPTSTEMRGSLNQQSALFARQLDNELKSTENVATVVQSKIWEVDFEILHLTAYDILSSVALHALQLHKRVEDPPEGQVAIYKLTMQ